MRSTIVLTVLSLVVFVGEHGVAGDQNAVINDGFQKYLREVLQNLKNNMATGIPELKIPPLDPLVLPERIDKQLKEGKILIGNLRVEGLQTLDLGNIDANLNNLATDVTVNIGRIRATGNYECDLLLARIFPIKGRGNVNIEFHDVTLRGKIVLKSEDFTMFEVTDIKYDIRLGGSNINFENIINPQLAPTINRILSGVLPLVTDTVLPKVNGRLTPLLIKLINKELTKVKITDLIDKINRPKYSHTPLNATPLNATPRPRDPAYHNLGQRDPA